MYDVAQVRADFPILSRQVNGKPLVYLDNWRQRAKPQVVDRRGDARLCRRLRQTSTAAFTRCRPSRPRNTKPCAASSRAS